ncbi:MAG: phosphate ABC transporter permease PstA [Asgard group archaeon]|nr:phosphate ABC transporter permease PstA [Asgard group archaeon]
MMILVKNKTPIDKQILFKIILIVAIYIIGVSLIITGIVTSIVTINEEIKEGITITSFFFGVILFLISTILLIRYLNARKETKTQKLIERDYSKISFEDLPRRNRLLTPKQSQKTAYVLLASSAIFILVILGIFLGFIIVRGFQNFSFKLIFSTFSYSEERYGIFPAILGTFLLIFGSIFIALPLGLSAAIYLTEYTRGGFLVSIIDQGINNLAGVPSVVIGFFGYSFFSITLGLGDSMIGGWLTLACMLLPTIIRTSQEALKSVPNTYREGSFALGATKWRTIRFVVLPPALPGITTGVILSLGRAAGETAAVLFVGSGIIFNKVFSGFTGTFMNLPYTMYNLPLLPGGIAKYENVMWLIALVLISIVFSLNGIAIRVRNQAEKKRAGM